MFLSCSQTLILNKACFVSGPGIYTHMDSSLFLLLALRSYKGLCFYTCCISSMRLPESLMSPNRPKTVSNINRILINALPAATVHLDVLCVCMFVCPCAWCTHFLGFFS